VPMIAALAGLALALNLSQGRLEARWDEIGAGVAWAFASGAAMTIVYYLNANALKSLDGRLRTGFMTAITGLLVVTVGAVSGLLKLPTGGAGWTGLVLLTIFYCVAMITLFYLLPRLPTTTTVALNFEPIALLVLSWLVLGYTVTPLQIAGACLTVGAIAWLGLAKR